MRLKIGFLIVALSTLVAFQNCGRMDPSQTSGLGPLQSEKVVGATDGYDKIVFDPQLEIGQVVSKSAADSRLAVDVVRGSLEISNGSAKIDCQIDDSRLDSLRQIMASAKICEPGPLPPDTVSCMALALADISLSNSNSTMLLRNVTCNFGTFLCDGQDSVFRALLADLRDHPPVGCSAQ